MAESYAFSLLGVMDCLWFHQNIFFTESPSVPCPKHLESVKYPPIENREKDLSVPVEITPQDDEEEARQDGSPKKERPMRLDFVACKSRSYSCSSGVDIRQKRLHWTKSCGELEIQEVKGFMDLGFKFDNERTSKKTMSVLPGLQRLQLIKTKPGRVVLSRNSERTYKNSGHEKDDDDDDDMEFTERDIVRPYLSEAWLIKTPDSPLLNLRMPRVSASADMKNHLRDWAKTVATVIRQES